MSHKYSSVPLAQRRLLANHLHRSNAKEKKKDVIVERFDDGEEVQVIHLFTFLHLNYFISWFIGCYGAGLPITFSM